MNFGELVNFIEGRLLELGIKDKQLFNTVRALRNSVFDNRIKEIDSGVILDPDYEDEEAAEQ